MMQKIKADSFEFLIVVLGTVCILAALIQSTPTTPLRSHQEWIEHEQDLAFYGRLKDEQEAARVASR